MELGKNMIDKVKAQREKDGLSTIIEKSQGNLPAAAIGGGVGLLVSYTRGYSLLVGFVVGALGAGLLANFIIRKKENDA